MFCTRFNSSKIKLSSCAVKCVFLGYSLTQKGYKCFSPDFRTEDIPVSTSFAPLTHDTDISQSPKESGTSPESPPLLTYHRLNVRNCPVTVPDNGVGESANISNNSRTVPNPLPTTISSLASPPIAVRKAPKIIGEAMSHFGWRQAMIAEMTALHSNATWELVSLSPGKSTVGCRWIYTVKVGPDGQIDRLKARLVTKGYTQIFSLDYTDTFSLVEKMFSVRLIHLFLLSIIGLCTN